MMKRAGKISEKIAESVMSALAGVGVLVILFIFGFVFLRAWPVIRDSGFGLFTNTGFDRQVVEAFHTYPPNFTFGFFGLIMGTIVTTLIALVLASLIGIGGAVAISEFSPKPVAYVLTSLVRLLASIPSVIFGLIGVFVIVPIIQDLFVTPELQFRYLHIFQITGLSMLAGVMVLTFMLVPTITALSSDAIAAVPKRFREAGFALGMTQFRVIWKIVLPTGRSGIIASVILAAGRGIGESIAITMVAGNIGLVPNFFMGPVAFLSPVLPLSPAILLNAYGMGTEAVTAALFTSAAILLLIGAALSITARLINSYMRKKVGDAN